MQNSAPQALSVYSKAQKLYLLTGGAVADNLLK